MTLEFIPAMMWFEVGCTCKGKPLQTHVKELYTAIPVVQEGGSKRVDALELPQTKEVTVKPRSE